MKKILFLTIIFYFLLLPTVFAIDNSDYLYIKNFETEIVVNKDSSLLITEKITVDFGNSFDRHGIFRVLPTQIKTEKRTIKTPIKLINITDFDNKTLKYTTIRDDLNHTITWKIGDPNKTVQGVKYYKIVYLVKNAISFQNPKFDELYWNLNGNFWELVINSFKAVIIFPKEISPHNTQIDYYTGYLGSKRKDLAQYQWINDNTLEFTSTRALQEGEGITVSVIFPKGIFTPYQLSFSEKYSDYLDYLWLLLPLIAFIYCFYLWLKYGKDPWVKKPIVPEYEPPEGLTPMEMGMLITNGKLKEEFIPAGMIYLAVNGFITIKETKKHSFFGWGRDYRIKKTEIGKKNVELITSKDEKLKPEIALFLSIPDNFSLSFLGNSLYGKIPAIEKSAIKSLEAKNLITQKGLKLRKLFLTMGGVMWFSSFLFFLFLSIFKQPNMIIFISLISPSFIFAIFSIFMPKKTKKGSETLWKIKGFKLYMETVEKYRQQFYEKENIFEKFLPYAMIFGMTHLWIKKMEKIYGEEYFMSYVPSWYLGAAGGPFNINNFASTLENISSSISSSTHTSSGASGSGSSGGGGGGGGGGSW